MLSFHNDPAIKEKYVARLKAHHAADEIVRGKYWENGKGCAVGCTIHGSEHKAYEDELGLPEWLAKLEDAIFECLPNEMAKDFACDFLEAIPVGKDLNRVKWQFCAFLLRENIDRTLALNISDELKKQVVDAIRVCLKLHEDAIETGEWSELAASAAWSAAASAADSAAWSAAASAADSAAWSAARSAAWSARSAELAASAAESAATSAAWSAAASAAWSAAASAADSAAWSAAASAADSAAWSAARSAAWSARSAAEYERYAQELLRLLKEA